MITRADLGYSVRPYVFSSSSSSASAVMESWQSEYQRLTTGDMGRISSMTAPGSPDRLRDLQSVTDAELAYLPLEELLRELLNRVVDILSVDTAVVLLLEEDGKTLLARAAKGLEEEVERGVRIPVGRGFAGRVAASRLAVRITDLEHAEIVNPLLRGKGLKSLLGVPLVVEGDVIGVLHVGSQRKRMFSDDDVELLQRAGDRAALAIRGRLTERERGLADALQRSLIPMLPEFPGVAMAGRYLPAASARLGGDWYDAFPLPGGRLALAIGDVVGRSFQAAALMGQLRSGLRAYALDGIAPQAVLERLSHLLRQLGPGRSATLLYLVIDPHGGRLTLASAGHPPALITDGHGEATYLQPPPSVPLGAVRQPHYEELEQRLEPGSTLILFTDGLVEQSGDGLDDGLERLRETMCAGDADELELQCDAIVDTMLPDGPGRDDAALLAIRALPLTDPLIVRMPAEVDSIPVVRRVLGRWLDEAGAAPATIEDFSLACSEACANAIEHAYTPAPNSLEVHASTSPDGVTTVTVRDFGQWRRPRGTNRGRGLLLMEGLMDSVKIDRGADGTTIRLTRQLEEISL
jgi:serine phosphatase RsbU (regulator of sigma subunit)/anti-sigma regulatory factor (Ser/Thr protein kinase)